VVRSVGGRTPTASLVTAGTAAATMLVLARFLRLLPQAVLAAIVIVYSVGLIDRKRCFDPTFRVDGGSVSLRSDLDLDR
jgi:MFS superfamily sulfate permease-like transporter